MIRTKNGSARDCQSVVFFAPGETQRKPHEPRAVNGNNASTASRTPSREHSNISTGSSGSNPASRTVGRMF